MVEIAQLADIEETDIIHYIIEGIPDHNYNKMLLFQADSIEELKSALRKYEKLKSITEYQRKGESDEHKNRSSGKNPFITENKTTNKVVKCFKCSEIGHISRYCQKNYNSTITCFKCKRSGHYAPECKEVLVVAEENPNGIGNSTFNTDRLNEYEHHIKFSMENGENGFYMNLLTLLDTGSPISFIQEQCVPMMAMNPILQNSAKYSGLNNSPLHVLGSITCQICLNNNEIKSNIFIVKNNTMKYLAVLGRDFLKSNGISFNNVNNEYNQNKPKSSSDSCEYFDDIYKEILNINVVDEVSHGGVNINCKLPCQLKTKIDNIGLNSAFSENTFSNSTENKDLISSDKLFAYINDLLIATDSVEDHLTIFNTVMNLINEHSLELRIDKCKFMYEEIVYLGHTIKESGFQPNPENLKAVVAFPIPKNTKEVLSFIGLCSYFRKKRHKTPSIYNIGD